jgi:AraC-like DNA-binding protein
MYVSIAVVRAIMGELERRGLSSAAVLAECGVDPGLLADAGAEIAVADYARIVEATIACAPEADFGLSAGRNAPTGAAHVVGFVLVSSRTLREAITMFQRYASLLFEGSEWTFVESEDEARFGFVHPHVAGPVARFEAELVMSYVLTRISLHFLGPNARLERARFAHPEPSWGEAYARTFQCPVEFGASSNELVFDRACLDVIQLHADAWVCELLRDRAERLLRERRSDDRLRGRVKDVLKLRMPSGDTQADAVAREVGLTTRTLRRKLSLLGCTLRELSDEARQELACHALCSPDRSIKDIAYALGFAEPSAFHRAFKRWTGLTPHQFRSQQATGRARRDSSIEALAPRRGYAEVLPFTRALAISASASG